MAFLLGGILGFVVGGTTLIDNYNEKINEIKKKSEYDIEVIKNQKYETEKKLEYEIKNYETFIKKCNLETNYINFIKKKYINQLELDFKYDDLLKIIKKPTIDIIMLNNKNINQIKLTSSINKKTDT